MTDIGDGTGPEDRTIGLEAVDGLHFESDGAPIAELDIESLDGLVDRGATIAELASGRRSWRFGHVIVDEAQDLTPMQWRMITRRSTRGSVTIVGDLAQRSISEPGSWDEHLPAGFSDFAYRELTINYRSPAEINVVASAVLEELAPELTAPEAIRSVGHSPDVVQLPDMADSLISEVHRIRAASDRGRMAVVGVDLPFESGVEGVVWLSPWQAKGLEFDTVVLAEPAKILDQPSGLSLLYVAVTRTTDRLIVAHQRPLPGVLQRALDGSSASPPC